MKTLSLIPLSNIPLIKPREPIIEHLINSAKLNAESFHNYDILVISHTLICKSKNYITDISSIKPSESASYISQNSDLYGSLKFKPDSRLIQLILDNSKRIIRARPFLITESNYGSISAHSGIDKSNIEGKSNYAYIPDVMDKDAKEIHLLLKNKIGKDIVVIVADSQGRPFRIGSSGVAIGIHGIDPLYDYRGKPDLYGYKLKNSCVNIADELTSAAQIVMGESNEGIPAVLIRNFDYESYGIQPFSKENYNIRQALRPSDMDLFRKLSPEDFLKGRRSFKGKFLDKVVDNSTIMKAMNYIRFTPSAHNSQPWKFILIDNKELRSNLISEMGKKLKTDLKKDNKSDEFIEKKIARSRKKFHRAPKFIIATLNKNEIINYSDDSRQELELNMGIQSVANAVLYLSLAFRNLGLESCWISAGMFAGDVISEVLKLGTNIIPQAIILAGYTNRKIEEEIMPKKDSRKDVKEFFDVI